MMSTDAISLPDDLTLCHSLIAQQHEQLLELQRQVQHLKYLNEYLTRKIYGPRSERVDPNQLALFELNLGGEEPTSAVAVAEQPVATTTSKPKKNGHGRRRFPDSWPRRQKVIDIDEEEKTCPCCGKQRQKIGEVITERAGIDPPAFYVKQYVQLKYACECEKSGVVTAEKPIMPIEKGNAEPDLLAFTAVSRFDDHSPYYRQEKGQFRRAGFHVSRSTQCDWMRQIAELCLPLYELMHALVLKSKFIGTDDTPVPVLVHDRGKTQEAHIWAYRGDKEHSFNVFDFTMTHAGAGPARFLGRVDGNSNGNGFRGYLQADAGSPYDPLFRQCDELIEVGCWAHTRRKFFEAKETNLAAGTEALARIHLLYEVEDQAKEMSADKRWALRQERSVPLLASMKTWLEKQAGNVLPKSPMGEAINYALNNWAALCRYTEDGELPIDNNAVERMLKLIALGRKNWLFAGSERGGKTAAVLFTLISSAKRHNLDTWAYLRDVIVRLADLNPRELEQLLPDRWKDSHLRRCDSS
jgi:transposase